MVTYSAVSMLVASTRLSWDAVAAAAAADDDDVAEGLVLQATALRLAWRRR